MKLLGKNSRLKQWLPRRWVDMARTVVGPLSRDPWMLDRLDREAFFRRAFNALSVNGIDGDYAEFGCYGGITFSIAYRESRRFGLSCKFWAFDSFQGLPAQSSPEDQHPEWIEGAMATSQEQFHKICERNGIPRTAFELVPGYYEESLSWCAPNDPPANICLAYIDCDLYSSTKTVLQYLLPRLKHGMILGFDDYYNYSSTQLAGERRVCLEVFENHPRWALIPYQPIGWFGMSFIIEDRQLYPVTSTQALS